MLVMMVMSFTIVLRGGGGMFHSAEDGGKWGVVMARNTCYVRTRLSIRGEAEQAQGTRSSKVELSLA